MHLIKFHGISVLKIQYVLTEQVKYQNIDYFHLRGKLCLGGYVFVLLLSDVPPVSLPCKSVCESATLHANVCKLCSSVHS